MEGTVHVCTRPISNGMRFEVPQFIEVEDKIFGPFTWKQFIYLAGGGGAALILFLLLPFVFFVIIAGPIVALAGFLAFHRVNNRAFSFFLESFMFYFTNTKLYLWKKRDQQTIKSKISTDIDEQPSSVSGGNLADLSNKLELNTLNKH